MENALAKRINYLYLNPYKLGLFGTFAVAFQK
jgi:hypothetical protein